ncbi:MAG: hypothetical protein M1820_007232 [Bogoriella megaspora]|nr:MAG: hypothetical protein M1820_007232 [Bogoriella megaspora]
MSIIRLAIYHGALTVQFDPDADFEYITTLTSYFSTLEVGLGLCASCLPVLYGLLQSKTVRDILRTIVPLESRASSHNGSHGSGGSRSTHNHTRIPFAPPRVIPSQGSESGFPLPYRAAESAGQEDIELGKLENVNGIVLTKGFQTDASEAHSE